MNCPDCGAENRNTNETCATCGRGLFTFAPGTVLDNRYEIHELLGAGGLGRVYKAHDRMLDELVAVKVLHPEAARSEELSARFRSEIRLARKVRHRNVCAIHEYGEDGPFRYVSMELVDGVDLHRILREKGPLPPTEAFSVILQLGKGLQAIHEAGVVHRDLKTPNIMRDVRGDVRLLDFGIAKLISRTGPALAVTAVQKVVGTPEYMSPEQIRGSELDARSDIYSVGIVIYELFTGSVPFQGKTPLDTLLKQVNEPPPLDGDLPRIPKSLLPVLRKTLAKDPKDRHASSAELVDAVRLARQAAFPEAPSTPPTRDAIPIEAPIPEPAPLLSRSTATPRSPAPIGPPIAPRPVPPPLPSPREGVGEPALEATSGRTGVEAPPVRSAPAPPTPRPVAPPVAPRAALPEPSPDAREPAAAPHPRLLWLALGPLAVVAVAVALVWSPRSGGHGAGASPSPPASASAAPPSTIPEGPPSALAAIPTPLAPVPVTTMASGPVLVASAAPSAAPSVLPLLPQSALPPFPSASPTPLATTPLPDPTPSPAPRRRLRPAPTPTPTPLPTPTPPPPALLELDARPWAEVEVDGKPVGRTPVHGLALAPGVRTVKLIHPDFWPFQKRVPVEAGKTVRFGVDLQWEGVPRGKPPYQLSADESSSDPYFERGVRQVAAGDYEEAILTLEPVVRRLTADGGNRKDLSRAEFYLGVAYFQLERQASAKARFESAIEHDGSLKVPPSSFPAKIVGFFNQVKDAARKK
jgi:eukaryotic-like serine/threonine-protein kinase